MAKHFSGFQILFPTPGLYKLSTRMWEATRINLVGGNDDLKEMEKVEDPQTDRQGLRTQVVSRIERPEAKTSKGRWRIVVGWAGRRWRHSTVQEGKEEEE